jgi:hypothetical protein
MNEKLTPCPLCGADKGYELQDGSTFRWWSVQCASCGQEVSECRSDGIAGFDDPKPHRHLSADGQWMEAGAYAQGLREEIAALRADAERYRTWRADYTGDPLSQLYVALLTADTADEVDAAIDAARAA